MRIHKKMSKRMPARRRYKIEKKIRDHNKKKRREAKRLQNKPNRKLVHIPNNCPFKEEALKEIEQNKERDQEYTKKLAIEGKVKAQESRTLEELVNDAEMKQIGLQEPDKEEKNDGKDNESQHKNFYREFQKVVASADVILEVVDARDPLGTRCPAVEKCVREADGKRLVLVLNKADLVPRETLDKWLKYLRRKVPCIPFKCSTQMQNNKLGRRKMKAKEDIKSGGVCVGAEGLMSLLGNYTRNKGIKTSIRVGVVGLPNVGKSSLINSLKRSRACNVGAVPGVTRSLQEVQLDSKIKLLDSPGLAFANNSDPHAALKNSVVSNDPIKPAEMIIARASKENLMKLYLVPDFESPTQFLASLAKRYGKFKKGGITDLEAAAKILVDDWNRGKISYHVQPPEEDTNHEVSSSIVTSQVAEFDLVAYDSKIFGGKEEAMEISSMSDEKQNLGTLVVTGKKKKQKKKNKEDEEKKKNDSLMELEGNRRLNKVKKLNYKKMKKQKARNAKTENDLVKSLDNSLNF